MDANELRALQAPLKKQYREQPETGRTPARAEATLDLDQVACRVRSWGGEIDAGLHPATGGNGQLACSADMLLEALVACAGVTISAVATAMGVKLRNGRVFAEGHWDARGTLGVDRDVPVGLADIALRVRVRHRRRCHDGAASRRDERAVLRHLSDLAHAAPAFCYASDRGWGLIQVSVALPAAGCCRKMRSMCRRRAPAASDRWCASAWVRPELVVEAKYLTWTAVRRGCASARSPVGAAPPGSATEPRSRRRVRQRRPSRNNSVGAPWHRCRE
jgi:hypothetical protein